MKWSLSGATSSLALALVLTSARTASADEVTAHQQQPAPPPKPVVRVLPDDEPLSPSTHFVPNRSLLTAGGAVFALGYGPAMVAAAPAAIGLGYGAVGFVLHDQSIGPQAPKCVADYMCFRNNGALVLLLPVAGPIVFATAHPRDAWLNSEGGVQSDATAGLVLGAVAQGVGLALIVASFIRGADEPNGHASPASSSADTPKRKPHAFVLPGVARGVGLTAGFTTW
jgi:predicted cobalt transporter CbtA